LRFQGACYRAHDPKWSFTPLSGEGAALTGGRFNRKGQPTLYTSLEIATAVAECSQGLAHRVPPLLVCQYDVDCEPIADLTTDAARAANGVTIDELSCAWLTDMLAGRDAPSWLAVDRLKAAGNAGMLVPSFAPAAPRQFNLVLWRWGAVSRCALPCSIPMAGCRAISPPGDVDAIQMIQPRKEQPRGARGRAGAAASSGLIID
jgi:RES domain-containing protein